MAQIQPFHGIYFNPSRAQLEEVLCPPYDVISSAQQAELYSRHPKNAVRLELGREADRYQSAEKFLKSWLADGTLIHDVQPAIYLLHQAFRGKTGGTVRRNGFLALCRLEEREKKGILPHEKTFLKPKEDRLRLLSQTKAQFSPIFSIYVDPSKSLERISKELSRVPPVLAGQFEDTTIEVRKLTDVEKIAELQNILRTAEVFIADGHHRYETALEYQRIRRRNNLSHTGTEGYNYTLMYFANVEEEGLVIYPIHRVIRGLMGFDSNGFLSEEWFPSSVTDKFDVYSIESFERLIRELHERGRFAYGVAIAGSPRFYLVKLKDASQIDELVPFDTPAELKQLDVVLLHDYLIPRLVKAQDRASEVHLQIDFMKDEREALNSIQKGESQIAFFLNPTRIDQILAVARAGHAMPQKSTFFYPKLPAGLVMYDLEREVVV